MRSGLVLLKSIFTGSLLMASLTGAAQTPVTVPSTVKTILLWPNGVPTPPDPNFPARPDAEPPRIDVYPVPDNQAAAVSHTAVLVLPGGGYQNLALDYEGADIAHWLNQRGIAAFVLHYRLAPRYHYPAPIQDGIRAMRYIRAHAAEYSVQPDRIGIWGFSAGGHLAASVTTHFAAGDSLDIDPTGDSLATVSSRPDFAILAYPVISMETGLTHPGSQHNLIGSNPDQAQMDFLSNEKQVTAQTPPCFLFHTGADPIVPVANSVQFYTALKAAGVPAELHVFEQGRHGVGLAPTDPVLSQWPGLLAAWLHLHGWMTATP